MIPLPLQKLDYRFVLLQKNSKKPFELEWQIKNNYTFNDPKLINWLETSGNVGLIGGYGGIFIIDDDTGKLSEDLQEIMHETYQEKTWSGKTHFIGETDYKTNHVFKNGLGELRVNEYQAVISPSSVEGKRYVPLNDKPVKFFSKDKLLEIINPYLRIQNYNHVEQRCIDIDTSRSGKEWKEVLKLIAKGKTKEDVFKEMTAFKKWVEAPTAYRELTYNKANEYIKNNPKGQKKEGEDEEIINTSLYINKEEGIIAEEVYQDGVIKFCIYNSNTKEIKYAFDMNINGVTYKPLDGEEVIKKAIKLPSGTLEYEDDENLDNIIKSFVNTWLDIPTDVLQFAIWNIKRSWVFERFHTLNYLRALGDTGQGKSRFLDTLGSIHYKSLATSGATTAAPIFRMIERWHGTLIMDEADFQKSDESQDIIKIINQGYERDKWIMRCDQNDFAKIELFDPFCPKILATRKAFDDKAVESRCITQVMKGTARHDIPFNINDAFMEETQKIRNMLLLWRFRNYFRINPDINPDNFDYVNLEPRVKQIISSFVSLFSNDEKQLQAFKCYILNYQENLIDERKNSFDGTIVGSIATIIEDSGQELSTICISAQDIIDKETITDFRGNLMKARGLSSHLKSLGFGRVEIKRVDEKTKRCIPLDSKHLEMLFKRYGYDVTVVTRIGEMGGQQKNLISDIKKEMSSPPYQRNNRNSVTKKWDELIHIWQRCSFENCLESPCNLHENGKMLCKKHFEEMAQQ
jgi:hypothetical protein